MHVLCSLLLSTIKTAVVSTKVKKPSAENNKMKKWTKEDWGTKSGKNSTEGKNATGERYLPKKKRDAMS